jgi:protein-L-isoaspartate(D-aspartate) O-methyltransferase
VISDKFASERALLVEALVQAGALRNRRYMDAMLAVKRELFVWNGYEKHAYANEALPLGDTDQTISAPEMCASMIEALGPHVGDNVLEVGSGSGYHAALLAECVAPGGAERKTWGKVTTLERLEVLWEFAKRNLEEAGYSNRVTCVLGDGTLGFPPLDGRELYERILITAGAPSPPRPLVNQLKKGGVMVIPIGGRDPEPQQMMMIIKGKGGEVEVLPLLDCVFVPLIGKHGWNER